jgi:DNA polymerase-4
MEIKLTVTSQKGRMFSAICTIFLEERRKTKMVRAMDAVNDKYGSFTVTFGSLLSTEPKGSHVISPAWRPDGIRNVDVQ